MDRKLTVSELIEYYVARYALPLEGRSSRNEYSNDGLKTYTAALTRIIKTAKVGEISLWDAIKPDEGVRRISVEEFERHCFTDWSKYIERNCEAYNAGALQADKERCRLYEEDSYWEARAAEADAARDRAMEAGAFDSDTEGVGGAVITDLTRRIGHDMMLEAIYDTLFESFQWEKLQADLEADDEPIGMLHGEHTPAEVMKARYRLQSYLNYVGKRKE